MIASVMRQDLPACTVTFLFTDVEGFDEAAALIEEAIRTCQKALGRASCAAILSDGASLPVQEAVRLALGLRGGHPPG